MDEFNPNKQDLFKIESMVLEIKAKKNGLVNRKMSLQNSLSHTKAEMRKAAFKSARYKELQGTYDNINREFNDIELEIKKVNEELSAKNKMRLEVEHHVRNSPFSANELNIKVHNKLNGLKQKYTEFAKDRTRVASLRVMANEFIVELEGVMKML